MRVAFIGLGVMGYPMAGYLAKDGHDVTVYNRTAQKAEQWCAEYGGQVAATPADAAGSAEFVFSCVGETPMYEKYSQVSRVRSWRCRPDPLSLITPQLRRR